MHTSAAEEGPHAVIEELVRAMNDRDINRCTACFDPAYRSDQPAHPARSFEGNEQVRTSWGQLFESVPDFLAELLSFAAQGERVWAEWRWIGTDTDGVPFEWRGVMLFGIRDGHIAWSRAYMEPVERDDIKLIVDQLAAKTAA